MAITREQEEFVSQFRAYMANAGAYGALLRYLKGLGRKDLRECLAIYFDVAKDYPAGQEHQRALTVFCELSQLTLENNDKYFALRFEALTQFSGSAWQKAYAELDPSKQRNLSRQVALRKRDLSANERRFLDEFEQHMKRPNQKAVAEFISKYKKADQLFDFLLVYVEASQKYLDNDKNSLIVFYGVSFQAVGLGDPYFAAKYESLVTSDGTIWKRRYDALDRWQRDEMLRPAIDDKKKLSTEVKGTIKQKVVEKGVEKDVEKDVVVQERHTIPALGHVSPDIEGPRPSPPVTDTQRKFVAAFRKFMQSNAKPAEFTETIFKLTGPQLAECVEAYLQASLEYGDKDDRSLYVFYGTASLALHKAEAYYAFKFAAGINAKGTILAKRFEALDPETQQKVLLKDIETKSTKARVLDHLKFAYYLKEKKDATLPALRKFEAVSDPERFKQLSYALDNCNRTFNLGKADEFSAAFDKLAPVLPTLAAKPDALPGELLLFATLLKRCREEKIGPTLRRQLYWYLVGILYLRVVRRRPEAYDRGFDEEEKQFLFDADDMTDPYFADFAMRIDYLWRDKAVDRFVQAMKGYAQLLLFAGKIGARLVPTVEAAAVRGLVEALEKEKPQVIPAIRIPIKSRDQGKTLRIYQTINQVFIVWWDRNIGAYIEHQGFEGVLFRVDSYDWLGRVYEDDAIWGEVYRSTSYLLEAIPFLFEIIGYIPDLVSGGITGLAKSIFANILIDRAVHELGINENIVQLAVLGAGLLTHHAFSEKKSGGHPGSGSEPHGFQRETNSKMIDGNGATNRAVDPPPSGGIGDHRGSQAHMADYDPRGVALGEGNVIGVHDKPPFETLTADRHVDPHPGAGGDHRGSAARTASTPDPPAATRQDLALAEEHRYDAEKKFKDAEDQLVNARKRHNDLEGLVAEQGGGASRKLRENLAEAKKSLDEIRDRYKARKYELRAADSRVERLTKELAQRGELQPKLRIEWNLPDKPTTFRYKAVEAKSWRPDAYVGTSGNRDIVQRLLNEDPKGELGKRLLNKGELYSPAGGDMKQWQAHPELIEMAHVLSKREGGREAYIIMTKARNQRFSADFERTGGVFKEDAIVIQGMAIDRRSAIDLGVPQSVIDRAPVITFGK